MASYQDARQHLRNLPASRYGTAGAAIPPATTDPHPALTIALYRLWDALRPFILLQGDQPSWIPQQEGQTALGIIQHLEPFLVSSPLSQNF
jgi:hypothetical protein